MAAVSRISILPFLTIFTFTSFYLYIFFLKKLDLRCTDLFDVMCIVQLSMTSEQVILQGHGIHHNPVTRKPFGLLHSRPHRYLYGESINSDGVVKEKCYQQYGSLATEGFNQPCSMRAKTRQLSPKCQ